MIYILALLLTAGLAWLIHAIAMKLNPRDNVDAVLCHGVAFCIVAFVGLWLTVSFCGAVRLLQLVFEGAA